MGTALAIWSWLKVNRKMVALAAALLLVVGAIVLHQRHAAAAIKAAELRGEQRGLNRMVRHLERIIVKSNAMAEKLKEKNRAEALRIGRAADALRVRGPGLARCAPGRRQATAAGGSRPAGGPADAAGPGLPEPDRAAVPWSWLVDRAEQCDLNRSEVISWREWYRALAPTPSPAATRPPSSPSD